MCPATFENNTHDTKCNQGDCWPFLIGPFCKAFVQSKDGSPFLLANECRSCKSRSGRQCWPCGSGVGAEGRGAWIRVWSCEPWTLWLSNAALPPLPAGLRDAQHQLDKGVPRKVRLLFGSLCMNMIKMSERVWSRCAVLVEHFLENLRGFLVWFFVFLQILTQVSKEEL